jgi:integrase
MLRLAYEGGKLLRLPVIRQLKEHAPRQGLFEDDQYLSAPSSPRISRSRSSTLVAIEHAYGWRCQSEVLTLERRHLDLKAGTLRLDPGRTKNDEGCVVYLTPEIATLLEGHLTGVEALQKQTGVIIPYLFPHLIGKKRRGQRIRDSDAPGGRPARRPGRPGMLRHDFRRTAVRNMVNAGFVERVAMTVTGTRRAPCSIGITS